MRSTGAFGSHAHFVLVYAVKMIFIIVVIISSFCHIHNITIFGTSEIDNIVLTFKKHFSPAESEAQVLNSLISELRHRPELCNLECMSLMMRIFFYLGKLKSNNCSGLEISFPDEVTAVYCSTLY